jgi:uncharacterized protein
MILDTPTGRLYGTLEQPEGPGPFPIALVIAGSGPTDRDGNSTLLPGRNDSLKLVARALAEAGVASLRYDKRAIGESRDAGLDEAAGTFDLMVEDAVRWLRQLGDDARFAQTLVVGHSEGSLVGMLASGRAGVSAFVSLEGAGRPAAEVLRSQLRPQLPAELMAEVDTVVRELEAGRTVETLPPGIAAVPQIGQALFRQSVQPYLVSWFRHDPARVLAALDIPTLVVQGTTDLQVPVEDGDRLAAAGRHTTLARIEGMNHVLKAAPAERDANLAAYSDAALPLAPGLVEALRRFLDAAGLTP